MKLIRSIGVISVAALIVIVMSVSFVSALEQNEASVVVQMPGDQRVRGEMTSVHFQFTSKTDKALSIYYAGIHFDWMDKDQLVGIDFSSNPKTVAAMKTVTIDIINYTVPTDAAFGAHKYYIGVDGYDQDGNPFSWTSDEATIYVGTPSSSQPTSTPTGTDSITQTLDMNLVYGGIVAVAVVIVILIAVVMKRRGAKPATKSDATPAVPPEPEQKPNDGQDFNI